MRFAVVPSRATDIFSDRARDAVELGVSRLIRPLATASIVFSAGRFFCQECDFYYCPLSRRRRVATGRARTPVES